jgi:GGDEF domain-containing protein
MAQTIQLVNSAKTVSQPPAQVVALDPRPAGKESENKKYIRVLQISDLLSRHLEMSQIIEAFMAEIASEIDFCGYDFSSADSETNIEHGLRAGFTACYRLNMQNQLLGEITLYKGTSFNSHELCQLEDLLCALIYPIKNALMYQVALKSAYQDPLTGLNNRTSMEKNLPREIDLAKRHRQSMAILVMDLDGFKQINDSCGHDVGDQVLRRCSIDELDLNGCGASGRVQISIGITLVRHSDNFWSAFKRADKALYQAKVNGKNQIIIC